MTIFLTGSHGFVGRHLFARLQSDGHKVVCYDRGMAGKLAPELFSESFDAIIHCAAEITAPHRMVESNLFLTHSILQFAQLAAIRKVIHVGSSSEYGKTDLPRREDMLGSPTCLYDGTKLAATALAQGFAAQFDMDICIARPFSLYGFGDTSRKLIPRLYAAHRERKLIDLFQGQHDWTWIEDFVDGLTILLEQPREITKGQIFNFGTGVSSSNLDVLHAMEAAVGEAIPVNVKSSMFHGYDADFWAADIGKAKRLGWLPRTTLGDGIREYVRLESA